MHSSLHYSGLERVWTYKCMWIQTPVYHDKSVYIQTHVPHKNVCIAHADKVSQSLRKVLGKGCFAAYHLVHFSKKLPCANFNATRKNCRSGKHWQGQKFPSPSESASSGVCCSADLKSIFPAPSLVPGLQNARTQHRGGYVWFEQDTESGLRSVSCSIIWHGGPLGKASSSWTGWIEIHTRNQNWNHTPKVLAIL